MCRRDGFEGVAVATAAVQIVMRRSWAKRTRSTRRKAQQFRGERVLRTDSGEEKGSGISRRTGIENAQADPARSAEILPWVHGIFGNLKTWLRGTFHGVSGKHLPRYLTEFVYRFDRRWREGELFGFVLRRAVHGEPLPYHRLVAEEGR